MEAVLRCVGDILPSADAAADGAVRVSGEHSIEQLSAGKIMANDVEWVEDVKRWYLAGARSSVVGADPAAPPADDVALGYEAADPALLARHWPDAPTKDR